MTEHLQGTMSTSAPVEKFTMEMLHLLQEVTNQLSSLTEIADGVYSMKVLMVNLGFIRSERGWVLVDAALPGSQASIKAAAEKLFKGPPEAIILTHGHFDHVGALADLISAWHIPVYAHPREIPYLTGEKKYPAGDPQVDPGLMAQLSPLYPDAPIDISGHLTPLEGDKEGAIPELSGWKWLSTPGHTPGHISLFREKDRCLIAGDAFTTTRQELLLAVLTQKEQISGPPAYYTPDWESARHSVELLSDLKPEICLTGHGKPWKGEKLQKELDHLARKFEALAMPNQGRYV